MDFYKCQYFRIEELVDKKTFEIWGDKAWWFFRPEALMSLDNIRFYFGKPVTVNNWLFGGGFQNRGLRSATSTVGEDFSFHKLGCAFDLDIQGITADEARDTIIKMKDTSLFYLIMCLETGISWTHFDIRNISRERRILLVAGG